MGHRHMAGYEASGRCVLAAVADISRETMSRTLASAARNSGASGDGREPSFCVARSTNCSPSDSALPCTASPSTQATIPITAAITGALMMPTVK